MPAIFDASGARPRLPLPEWAWLNEQHVTDALTAQLDRLHRDGLDDGARFVFPFGLLSDVELIAGRVVVRADVDGPMVAFRRRALPRRLIASQSGSRRPK